MITNASFDELCRRLKREVPGSMAVAIYGFSASKILAVASDVPDTNVDHMSSTHLGMFDQFASFMRQLPPRISGRLHSVVLGLDTATFFMTIDTKYRLAMMIACDTKSGNRGLMRVLSKRYLEEAVQLLDEGSAS